MAWDYQTALAELMTAYDRARTARDAAEVTAATEEFSRRVASMRNVPCPETHDLLNELERKLEHPNTVHVQTEA